MTTPNPTPISDDLLPCPFCGCDAVWFKTGRDIGIECRDGFDCPGRAQTNVYAPDHRQDAIDQWNRRAGAPKVALGFDPTNHHNAAKCPYCRPSGAQGAVPTGWQLVPKEVTERMHIAAVRALIHSLGNDDCPPRVWAAMLAAAPPPAAQPQGRDAEAVADVPIHPRQGPLWANVRPRGAETPVPSYPLRALYFDSPTRGEMPA